MPKTEEQQRRDAIVRTLIETNGNVEATARTVGVHKTVVYNLASDTLARIRAGQRIVPGQNLRYRNKWRTATPIDPPLRVVGNDDAAKTGARTVLESVQAPNDQDILRHLRMDEDRWQVAGLKVDVEGHADGARKYRVNARFNPRRKAMPAGWAEMETELFDRLRELKARPIPRPPRLPGDPHQLHVDLYDAHFGKLAWGAEVGIDNDLRHSEAVYDAAIVDLLEQTAHLNLAEIVLTVGQDFYHIDNLLGTTTAGTHQDADGRYPKIIGTGEVAVIRGIERFRTRVPKTRIIWVPGNHDRLASYHLMRTLAAYYHDQPDVEVDRSPAVRKYIRYGPTLIGITHGHNERPESLPNLFMTDPVARPLLEGARFLEWHLGHFHRRKEWNFLSVDSRNGVLLRYMDSLSSTDSWHYSMGYVSTRTAQAFAYSQSKGFRSSYLTAFTDDLVRSLVAEAIPA